MIKLVVDYSRGCGFFRNCNLTLFENTPKLVMFTEGPSESIEIFNIVIHCGNKNYLKKTFVTRRSLTKINEGAGISLVQHIKAVKFPTYLSFSV